MKPYKVTDTVQLFPQQAGWHYIAVPTNITQQLTPLANRGLIAISATLGNTSWQTSLLPKGDGTHFIPLSKQVRKAEDISLGDTITIRFTPR